MASEGPVGNGGRTVGGHGVSDLGPGGPAVQGGAGALGAAFEGQQAALRQLMEDFEAQSADAMEQLVAGKGFSELLARVAENVAAVSKLGADFGDLVLRNMRIAGRADINHLARQLARTEDKLELLLQAVERLEDSRDRR